MAARNFYEADNHILYPRIDIAGEKWGITGMEFPVLNYLIYLVSLVFGYAHWYGRLINLVISSFGIFYFYKLTYKYFGYKIAFNAAFLLIFSVWFNYSRKIMPDTFSMSILLAGIYYGTNYFDGEKKFRNLILYFLLTLVGLLSKLPSAYLLILFLFFIVDKRNPFRSKIIFSVTTGAVVISTAVYYFYWVPHLNTTFGFIHFFMGKSFIKGFMDTCHHFDLVLERFYLDALQIIGFATFIAGIILAFIKKQKRLIWVFGISFLAFLSIIFKSGSVFYHHSYYIVPFAPVMALVAGYAVEQLPGKKLVWSLLLLISLENLLNKLNDYQIHDNNLALLHLEKDLDKYTKRNDLILINSKNVPTPMYFAHRKGWLEENEKISQKPYIETLKQRGLKYIVILKKAFGKVIELDYKIMFENENYTIYRI